MSEQDWTRLEPQTEGHAKWCDCSVCVPKRDAAHIETASPLPGEQQRTARDEVAERLERVAAAFLWDENPVDAVGLEHDQFSRDLREAIAALRSTPEAEARVESPPTATIALCRAGMQVRGGLPNWMKGAPTHVFPELIHALEDIGWVVVSAYEPPTTGGKDE